MIADLDPNPPNKTLTRAVDRLRALDGRAALVVVVVAVLAVALGGWTMWHSRPHAVEVGPALATAAPHRIRSVVPLDRVPAPPAPNNSAPPANLVVDVEGKVRHPGVVAVAPGSRVGDALQAAGGPMPGVPTTSVNLAEPLSDGQQIVLGEPAPAAPGGTTRGRGRPATTPGQLLDLNTATEDQLHTLPGVGPVLAGRILDFRRTHGRFESVEQLREVPGIGPTKFAAIKSRVRV